MDPAALDQAAVAAGDLIVLDHPGKLTDETVKLLAALLHRGRPILYVAAELIDATNLKRLGEAAGSGLQMPVEFTPPPAGQARRDLFYTAVRRDSAPLGVFGDSLTSVMGRLRFAGGLSSRRLGTGVDADVLAAYNDGSAGIVLCASDAGVLAVLNADLAASNLPRTSAFLPMLTELVGQMLDRGRATEAAYCGEPLVVHLPAEAGAAAGLRSRAGPGEAGTETARRPLRRVGRRGRGRGVAVVVAGPAGRLPRPARQHAGVRPGRHHPSRGEPARCAAARGADQPAGRRTRGGLSRRRRRGPAPR